MERAGIVAEPASPLECWLAWAVEHARRLDPLTDLGWLPAGNPLKEARRRRRNRAKAVIPAELGHKMAGEMARKCGKTRGKMCEK